MADQHTDNTAADNISAHRIQHVVDGHAQFTTLNTNERRIAHAIIDANISTKANTTNFADNGPSSSRPT